jgi:hypothetical protein
MKTAAKSSAILTFIAIAIYLIFFIIHQEVPNVYGVVPFTGIALPFELSRALDLFVLFPLALTMVLLILYLKTIEEADYKLYSWLRWQIAATLIISFIFTIQMNVFAGLITGLSLCLIFGIGSIEFGIIIAVIFGLIFWLIAGVESGLLLGFIPGMVACVIFGSISLIGFGLKKALNLKK